MEPLKIQRIPLPHRAVFGPMAGFTDAPCRRLRVVGGAPAWGCKTLPVQNIFAWNVHFLPNVTF